MLLLGGASLLMYGAVALLHSGTRTDNVIWLAYWLSWLINWPHFSATSYRLYRSWDNVERFPLTAIVVPILLVGAVLGSFAYPAIVAPCFVKLFLIWSPYHFSGQTVGITLVYLRRAGVVVERLERMALTAFIYGTFILNSARAEVGLRTNSFYGIDYPTFGLPAYVGDVVWWWIAGTAVLFGLVYLRWCRRAAALVPPIVLLPAVTQFVWFVPGGSLASFNEFVPLFHSLQYLLIAWAMQLKERFDADALTPSRRYVMHESGRWGCVNLLGGIGLFWALPRLAAPEVGLAMATGVVIAAVQIHHFFVDGVIWKLRSPSVSSPLLVHVGDLMVETAPASQAA
jgi:hypothetical protein